MTRRQRRPADTMGVGARRRARADRDRRRPARPRAGRRRRLVARRRQRPAHGVDYALLHRRRTAAARPAVALAAGRRARAVRLYDHARFDWSDDGWRGVTCRAACSTSCTSARSRRRAPSTPRSSGSTISSTSASTSSSSCPSPPSTARAAGATTASPCTPSHEPYGGPDGLKRFVDACHARGLGVVLDVVYNHLGPSGNYLAEFGPYFTDAHSTPWGSAVNLDGPGSDEVRRFILDNALHVAARLPRRRAAAGRRARARRHPRDAHPRGARRRGRGARRAPAAGRCSSSPSPTSTTRG